MATPQVSTEPGQDQTSFLGRKLVWRSLGPWTTHAGGPLPLAAAGMTVVSVIRVVPSIGILAAAVATSMSSGYRLPEECLCHGSFSKVLEPPQDPRRFTFPAAPPVLQPCRRSLLRPSGG